MNEQKLIEYAKLIEPDMSDYIKSIPGVGYKLDI